MKKRKFAIIILCLSLCLSACLIAACENGGNKDAASLSVEITNKTALTADWYVYGEERTVEYSAPDGAPVTIISDDEGVIKAEGATLSPVRGGKATVTVKAGRHSDSVDITVLPALSALNISNKSELLAAWVIGDGTRTVNVDSVLGVPYVVSSSDESVIEVSGNTLTAKAVGEATVTVKAGSYSDSVTLTVRPVLSELVIENKSELVGAPMLVDDSFRLKVYMAPSAYYDRRNTKVEIVSSDPTVAEIDGYDIKALSSGNATVTVKYADKSDSVSVKVVSARPTITVDGDPDEISSGDKSFLIPAVTAKSVDNSEISNSDIKITLSDPKKMNYDAAKRTLTVTEYGEYSITFAVADRADANNTASVTLPVKVYRNVFKAVTSPSDLDATFDYADDSMYAENKDQKLTTTANPLVLGQFDMAASKYYYAEAKFSVVDPQSWVQVGMSHSPDGESGKSPLNWLVGYVDRAGTDSKPETRFMLKDIDIYNDPSWSNTVQDYQQFNIQNYRGIKDSNRHEITLATMRMGENFYWFVNGSYAGGWCDMSYANVATAPGIYGYCMHYPSSGRVTISGIDWISGEEATKQKHDELMKQKLFDYHVWNEKHLNFTPLENGLGFTINENCDTAYDDGNANNCFMKSGITTYTVIDGDFKVEYDYTNTKAEYDAVRWTRGALLNILSATKHHDGYQKAVMASVGVRITGKNATSGNNVVYHGSPAMQESGVPFNAEDVNLSGNGPNQANFTDSSNYTSTNPYTTLAVHNNESINFSVERRLKSDHAEYTMKITIDGNTVTRVMDVNCDGWSDPVMLVWSNQSNFGTVSDISLQQVGNEV